MRPCLAATQNTSLGLLFLLQVALSLTLQAFSHSEPHYTTGLSLQSFEFRAFLVLENLVEGQTEFGFISCFVEDHHIPYLITVLYFFLR